MALPAFATALQAVTKDRLIEMGRDLGVPVPEQAPKPKQIEVFGDVPPQDIFAVMARDELRAACRALKVPDGGRGRSELIERIAKALGIAIERKAKAPTDPTMPKAGDVAIVRHRQYLVESVSPPIAAGDVPLVSLVCLDDDAQGRRLVVPWGPTELGARVIDAEGEPDLGTISRIDPPRTFAAYLHAVKWNCVTATDPELFQSPFRSGIKLMAHQLTPLKKALALPRVNLFIADDVGLGKTIEAGLVVQEMILRQRVDYVVVVSPASVALQWRSEMESRFGLRFEIYNRELVARRRRERGFGVNPWRTHNRFVISYQTLRRPEYFEPLLQILGDRRKKSLLILDEAHTAAPASASRYAIDTSVTKTIRDIAKRFENRLFLSATPHNGHSNSFSSLLEILDEQRFTRGVKVRDPKRELGPVMVRRLKSDLRGGKTSVKYPNRHVVPVLLKHDGGSWSCAFGRVAKSVDLGKASPVELDLAQKLAEYTALACPTKGRGRLAFINLQKRLLSSVEAFYRTLRLHADGIEKKALTAAIVAADDDEDERGPDDEQQETLAGLEVARASAGLQVEANARELLAEMLSLAGQHRNGADAKVLALLEWIRAHQCDGVKVGGGRKNAKWSDTRVIVFTEFGDTKRWLLQLLLNAIEGTQGADERIVQLHGGMSDEAREAVQFAFNSRESKVRILLATDSAREGINLQGCCSDLFHFDIPWNPARMEQRNGRIDRTLQPSDDVHCHYFHYVQRTEDPVLEKVVEKVERIQRELGSLADVVMTGIAEALEKAPIVAATREDVENIDRALEASHQSAKAELEAFRAKKELDSELDAMSAIEERSRAAIGLRDDLLRDAVEVGCTLAGAKPLEKTRAKDGDLEIDAWKLPEFPASWEKTLDTLRSPRRREESFEEWRERPLQDVVFTSPERMNSGLVHLHLSHPLVQRILSRFLAQGHSAFDLSRVTIVKTARESVARVVAFGRVSLFGPGGVRLHDRVIPIVAKWTESKGKEHLKSLGGEGEKNALLRLEESLHEAPALSRIAKELQKRLAESAPGDFTALWSEVKKAAETEIDDAVRALRKRGREEADAMKAVLEKQRESIEEELGLQLGLPFAAAEADQKDQFDKDKKHMQLRLAEIERELESEPAAIRARYEVSLRRLSPVGLVYLWPATR